MNKKITFDPVNTDISLLGTALRLKNSFMQLGFETSSAFSSIVQHYKPEYRLNLKKLEQWWLIRLKDHKVNQDVEMVLEKLKNE
jgi:hypothetical protein